MPIHDWKSVDAGIFHDFHQGWSWMIRNAVNRILPSDHYAIVEQNARMSENNRYEPDVVTLQVKNPAPSGGGVLLAAPPQTSRRQRVDLDGYTAKKNIVSVRHVSGDRLVALIEIVSPGNKSSHRDSKLFVKKIEDLLRSGIHVLIVDLFAPTKTNPHGIHEAIWQNFTSQEPNPIDGAKSLLAVSYENHGGGDLEAYIEAFGVGDSIPEMPVFLEPGGCVMVPLQPTYDAVYADVPPRWQTVIEAGTPPAASPS